MHPNSSRADHPLAALSCPDCDATAYPGQQPPVIRHRAECPAGRAEDDMAADDARWLAAHPGRTRVRPLAGTETAALETAGAPMPRRVRRRARVYVTTLGPPGRLLRRVEIDGATRMTAIIEPAECAR
ncbi:MAG: hypothetical protein M3308_10055 [Actinomycetota bacterium]|nr:hypothetical protein [Actinomycetota bacterium]